MNTQDARLHNAHLEVSVIVSKTASLIREPAETGARTPSAIRREELPACTATNLLPFWKKPNNRLCMSGGQKTCVRHKHVPNVPKLLTKHFIQFEIAATNTLAWTCTSSVTHAHAHTADSGAAS